MLVDLNFYIIERRRGAGQRRERAHRSVWRGGSELERAGVGGWARGRRSKQHECWRAGAGQQLGPARLPSKPCVGPRPLLFGGVWPCLRQGRPARGQAPAGQGATPGGALLARSRACFFVSWRGSHPRRVRNLRRRAPTWTRCQRTEGGRKCSPCPSVAPQGRSNSSSRRARGPHDFIIQ